MSRNKMKLLPQRCASFIFFLFFCSSLHLWMMMCEIWVIVSSMNSSKFCKENYFLKRTEAFWSACCSVSTGITAFMMMLCLIRITWKFKKFPFHALIHCQALPYHRGTEHAVAMGGDRHWSVHWTVCCVWWEWHVLDSTLSKNGVKVCCTTGGQNMQLLWEEIDIDLFIGQCVVSDENSAC